jgi:hypothetical protein
MEELARKSGRFWKFNIVDRKEPIGAYSNGGFYWSWFGPQFKIFNYSWNFILELHINKILNLS